ncbi:MAG: hypothetical protein AAFY26_13765 [Cyanobacteria bacterium J06638_22]
MDAKIEWMRERDAIGGVKGVSHGLLACSLNSGKAALKRQPTALATDSGMNRPAPLPA